MAYTHRRTRKGTIDAKVSRKLGIRKEEINRITSEFLLEVRNALIRGEAVCLDGFGDLTIFKRRREEVNLISRKSKTEMMEVSLINRPQFIVNFRKAPPFRRALIKAGKYEEDGNGEIRGGRNGKPRRVSESSE